MCFQPKKANDEKEDKHPLLCTSECHIDIRKDKVKSKSPFLGLIEHYEMIWPRSERCGEREYVHWLLLPNSLLPAHTHNWLRGGYKCVRGSFSPLRNLCSLLRSSFSLLWPLFTHLRNLFTLIRSSFISFRSLFMLFRWSILSFRWSIQRR